MAEQMKDWFENKLITVPDARNMRYLLNVPGTGIYGQKNPRGFAEVPGYADILSRAGSNAQYAGHTFGYDGVARLAVGWREEEGQMPQHVLPPEVYESGGTIRLLELVPVLSHALETGATLGMDAFDASLHPAIGRGIISAFHDNEFNTKNAQLIVNTHDGSLMDANLLRRDEIHFVDPDPDTGASEHYTLADFFMPDDADEWKTESLMGSYARGAYGAYPDIDVREMLSAWQQRARTLSG